MLWQHTDSLAAETDDASAMKAVMQECYDGALKYSMEKSIINQDVTLKT